MKELKEFTRSIQALIKKGKSYLEQHDELDLQFKPSAKKWSKKELVGHLIDSGINNLQRFTEIQFESKPYVIRKYRQDELVEANAYNGADTKELIDLWTVINKRIVAVILLQSEETLAYQIEIEPGQISDLNFLIRDYVDHMEHHIKQIIG